MRIEASIVEMLAKRLVQKKKKRAKVCRLDFGWRRTYEESLKDESQEKSG